MQSSRFLTLMLGVALAVPAAAACTASASFKAGGEEAKAPPPPPPPPPPATTTEPAPTATTPAPAPTPSATTTATTPATDPNAAPKVTKDQLELPGQIVFENNSAVLKPESDAAITQLKNYLDKTTRVTKLRIEGHTDNTGSPQGNETLSGQRALAVKAALVAKGISKDRLIAVGFGQNKPIADNATEEGRAKNRRTEFHIAELGGKKYLGLDPTGGGKVFE